MTPLRLPITIRVPAVVTLFMVAVSAFASERVLTRLDQTQTRHIGSLSAVYSGGSLTRPCRCDGTRGHLAGVRRSRQIAPPSGGPSTCRNDRGEPRGASIIASSDPLRIPSQTTLPEDYRLAFGNEPSIVVRAGPAVAIAKRDVVYEGRSIGSIYAKVDIAPQIAERNDVLRTLILTNVLLTLVLGGAGLVDRRRMMRPMGSLPTIWKKAGPTMSGHSRDDRRGGAPRVPAHLRSIQHAGEGDAGAGGDGGPTRRGRTSCQSREARFRHGA